MTVDYEVILVLAVVVTQNLWQMMGGSFKSSDSGASSSGDIRSCGRCAVRVVEAVIVVTTRDVAGEE